MVWCLVVVSTAGKLHAGDSHAGSIGPPLASIGDKMDRSLSAGLLAAGSSIRRVHPETWRTERGSLDPVPKYRVYHRVMRSSEVAEKAGVNVQTLRYYERRRLLPEPARLTSGYRAYGPDAVRIVRFVRRAQQLGFSLEEIDTLLDLSAGGPRNCDAARALACDKVAQLDEKLGTITAMRDSLLRLIETCALPRARRECPLLHAMDTEEVPGGTEEQSRRDIAEVGWFASPRGTQ